MPPLRFIACFLLLSLLGCGSSDSGRLALTGKANYQGEPIAYGRVTFEPDSAKGNEGPQGSGEIVKGVFKTTSGFEPCLGHQIVRIQVFDGKATPGDSRTPHGMVMCPEQIVEVELKPGTKTLDFDLPVKAPEP